MELTGNNRPTRKCIKRIKRKPRYSHRVLASKASNTYNIIYTQEDRDILRTVNKRLQEKGY